MGLLDRWLGRKSIRPIDLRLDLLADQASKSGLRVTWQEALQASTALACARVIAEGIAQVPLKLHRTLPRGGSEPATDHPLYAPISRSPNSDLTSFEWRETAGIHLALVNRSYALIEQRTIGRERAVALYPVSPDRMRTERRGGATRYFARLDDDSMKEEEVAPERVLHLRGPSWNGWEGLDGVRLARDAIGLALATEEHGARMFKNGAIVGGILSTDQPMSKEQIDLLRASWEQAQAGVANAYKTAVLFGGMKWAPRAMQNDQAQWIEVRRFQVQEVCRFFRVLPIMVGEADKTATYASSEQMFLAHIVHTMGPWYERIEQRLDLQLLTPQERAEGYFFKFNVNGLLRGSHRDRAEFYRTMHGIGALNANEIRELEERNPYTGGDEYMQPLNMAAVGADAGAGEGQQ